MLAGRAVARLPGCPSRSRARPLLTCSTHVPFAGCRERQSRRCRGQLAESEAEMCQHLPACPDGHAPDRVAARVVAGHPGQGWSLLCNGAVLFEDGGALLADGQAVAPPASALRRRLASSRGRHEQDGGRWLTQGRRGKTGPMCAGCCGESSLTSPQHSKPQCSNGLRGTCHASRPGNRQPSVGATGGSAAMAADRCRGIAGGTANSPTCRMAQGRTGGPRVESPLTRACHQVIELTASAAGLDLESVKWLRVLAGTGPRRKAAQRKPRAALAADGYRP